MGLEKTPTAARGVLVAVNSDAPHDLAFYDGIEYHNLSYVSRLWFSDGGLTERERGCTKAKSSRQYTKHGVRRPPRFAFPQLLSMGNAVY